MSRTRDAAVESPLRHALRRLAANPEALRITVCVGALVLGQLLVVAPLGGRLARARADRDAAAESAARAEAATHLAAELGRLRPRSTVGDDLAEWQAWVLAQVQTAGLKLRTFEPRGTEDTRGFRLLEFDMSAHAESYAQVVDLVDRLERGERLLRVSVLQLDQTEQGLSLAATLLGLVELSATGEAADA